MNWFHRVEGAGLASSQCPACGASWVVSPGFDHHVRRCNECCREVVELNMVEHIFVVAVEDAPPLVRSMLKQLQSMTENDAYTEVANLIRLFNPRSVF